MMYVSDRNVDSICDTALAFFVMKLPYKLNHSEGSDKATDIRCDACLDTLILQSFAYAGDTMRALLGLIFEVRDRDDFRSRRM